MTYNKFFKTSSRVIAVGLCVLAGYSGDVRAELEITPEQESSIQAIEPAIQEENVLTEAVIQDFYKKAADVQLIGATETLEFLEKHTHDDAQNKLHLRTLIQGKPPEKKTVITDKKTVLNDTKGAYEKGHVDSVETNIISMDIAQDGQSAAVVEKTTSDFTLNISETEKLLVSSKQSCNTGIVLNDGVVQTKDSECDVEVSVKPVK